MTDHRNFRDETAERPATWYMPHRTAGPSEVYERKGYVLRLRGDTPALRERLGVEERRIPREFVCPVHGRFTLEVDEQTDEVACPDWRSRLEIAGNAGGAFVAIRESGQYCGLTSSWSPSSVGQGKSAGEVDG